MRELTENVIGRLVPTHVNGREFTPYQGVGKFPPQGRKYAPPIRSCAQYPADGNKIAPSLVEALHRAGLADGMTLSSHHHFRDGDRLMAQVFAAATELGVRDLVWQPTATFPCHAPFTTYLENGLIHHIEGSLNGPLGRFASTGRMRGVSVLRSHGGAIERCKMATPMLTSP